MRTVRPHIVVQRWARQHEGIIVGRNLRELEVGRGTAQWLLATEQLSRVGRGIYRSGAWPDTERQVLIGQCLAHPGLLVSHTTAGKGWEYRKMQWDKRFHFLCPHGCSPTIDGAVLHRCRRIDPVDMVPFDDGVWMTSPPRTVFDSSWIIGLEATISVIEQVLAEEYCTFGTLEDTCRRLYHPRRPGSRVMRAALASRPPWRAAMQSSAEERVLAAIACTDLPTPVTQHPIRHRDGREIHVDFAWPEWQVALEVDEPYWHDFMEDRRRDKRRDIRSAAVGWATCRLPTTDRGPQLHAELLDVRDVLLTRGWRP